MTQSTTYPPTPAQADSLLWAVRTFVYERFAETAQPPSVHDAAAHFGVDVETIGSVYTALDAQHAFFLEPGRLDIRMANPFSAVPTPFRVHIGERTYWANCAWDALGIPAALHRDAMVEASYAGDGDPLHLTLRDGQIAGPLAADETVAHLLVPFHRWYENMNFT